MKDYNKQIEQISFRLSSSEKEAEFLTRILMYRILSEVEIITDELGVSRKELASRIGTSPSYITQLFRGNKIINLNTIAKIEKALDIKFEINAVTQKQVDYYKELDLRDDFSFVVVGKDKVSNYSIIEQDIDYSMPISEGENGEHKLVA